MQPPKPIGHYTELDGTLHFQLLHVGEGVMALIVFPDKTTMLVDCNVTEDNEDQVLGHLDKLIPERQSPFAVESEKWIDIFVNSHRDVDHLRGLKSVHARFPVRSIWDAGQTGQATDDSSYQFYMRLRRRLVEEHGDNAVIIPAPSATPLGAFGGALVYCLCSSLEQGERSISLSEARIQHTNSIVLSVRYAGRSILLAGDSDWRAWRDKIVPQFGDTGLLSSEVLVASHHGSRSFFTDETINDAIDPEANPETTYIDSIEHIEPSIILIPCGPYAEMHHPNKDAMKIYKAHTSYEQVYTTYDRGTFYGYIGSDGKWTVVPARFRWSRRGNAADFKIACKVEYNGTRRDGHSGDNFPTGSNLRFSVRASGGLLDPFEKVRVWWEVSNGGIRDDHEHQEIYYKEKGESEGKTIFRRKVSYDGRHLLRCRVKNSRKRFDVTKVFVVNGAHEPSLD